MSNANTINAAETIELTATVTKAELKQLKPFGRSYGSERWDVKVMVALQTDDGRDFWFYSPAAHYSVTTSGPASIACVLPNDWVTSKRWYQEGAFGTVGFGDTPVSRINVGDRLTIKAKVKGSSRFGIRLSNAKRTDYSFAEEKKAWLRRRETARAKVPAELAPDATPPEIPGVKWAHIGHYGAEGIPSGKGEGHKWLGWRADFPEYESDKLIAWAEGCDIEQAKEPH